MMSQSAMSGFWDSYREPLYDFNSEEWSPFQDDLNEKGVNDPLLEFRDRETSEETFHEIDDLGKIKGDQYWLEELPLFEEIQSLEPFQEPELLAGEKLDEIAGESKGEANQQPPVIVSTQTLPDENSPTFIISNEDIFYIDPEPFINVTPLPSEREKPEESEWNIPSLEPFSTGGKTDVKMEMALMEEILRNTARELDWESDTTGSETSSDGPTGSEASPKTGGEEEEEEESDDPEWKPESAKSPSGRKSHGRRPKPYSRGGSLEEKRLRKKEQNKVAAARYRMRLKEAESIRAEEEKSLLEKREKLKERVSDIEGEIRCVKGLLRDLFKAKGLIN